MSGLLLQIDCDDQDDSQMAIETVCCVETDASCCYRTGIPVLYENTYLDLSYSGFNEQRVATLRPPDGYIFNLTLQVLPDGWLYDALQKVLYYPAGYTPTGRFAVWSNPIADPNGGYVWTATEIVPLLLEQFDCSERDIIKAVIAGQYYCLSAQILTTLTFALSDLRDRYGTAVQNIFNGGLISPSTFQVAKADVPFDWVGSVNIGAGVWTTGRCALFAPVFDVCAALSALEVVGLPAPANSSVAIFGPNGCFAVSLESFISGTGGASLIGATYTHDQILASAVWIVTHNLNSHPSVTVVNSAGDTVFGDVQYNSFNQLTINFSAPFSGKAYLN